MNNSSDSTRFTFDASTPFSFDRPVLSSFQFLGDSEYENRGSESRSSGIQLDFKNSESSHSDSALFASADKIVSRPVFRGADMMSPSSMAQNYSSVHSKLDVVRGDSYRLVPAPIKFSPKFNAALSTTVSHPSIVPCTTNATTFDCCRSAEDIVTIVNAMFIELNDKVVVQFSSFDYTWRCSYKLSDELPCKFRIRVYRYPQNHAKSGTYAVEFQRTEGNRLPYMKVFVSCRELLTRIGDEPEECPVMSYVLEEPCGIFKHTKFESAEVGMAAEEAVHVGTGLPSVQRDQVKGKILEQLAVRSSENYYTLLENIQMISSVYSTDSAVSRDPSYADPSPADRELFRALCEVACLYSKDTRDWIYQHAIIAVADMLSLFDKYSCVSAESSSSSSACSFLRTVGLSEDMISVLKTMACEPCSASESSNPFLSSKCRQISRLVSYLNWN